MGGVGERATFFDMPKSASLMVQRSRVRITLDGCARHGTCQGKQQDGPSHSKLEENQYKIT
jgi:hypothetical protein